MALKHSSSDFGISFRTATKGDDGYVLSVVDKNGAVSLQLALSAYLIESVILSSLDVRVVMNPDGTLGSTADSIPDRVSDIATINLDDLVRQAITPQMLEDEPEAVQMLQALRERLLASLAAVESAIADQTSQSQA